jgi:hypothetical protein
VPERKPSDRKPPDWTRTGTVAGYAKYLREQSGALCVLVIRVGDAVLAADPGLAPTDAAQLIVEYLPHLAGDLDASRKEKRPAARLELGELHE